MLDMKTKNLLLIIVAFQMLSCSHMSSTDDRSPAAISGNGALDVKFQKYKQILHTTNGKLIPLHYLQTDGGQWYLALSCAQSNNETHNFEIYNKAFPSVETADKSLTLTQLKTSNPFNTESDCQRAFEKLQSASNSKPVCLKETTEGVLLAECRSPRNDYYERHVPAYGARDRW